MKQDASPPQFVPLFVICFFAFNSYSTAQTPKSHSAACEQQMSLEALRSYALSQSPLVAEIDREYARELADAIELETPQNPELQIESSFTAMDLQGANDAQSQISIEQPLRLSNLGQRAKVAELIRKAGKTQKKAKLLELTQRLTLQFKTLYVYQRTEELLHEAAQRASQKVSIIEDGVKKGLLSQGDEALFIGEKYRLQAQQKGAIASVANLRSSLSRALALPCAVITTAPNFEPEIPPLEELFAKARQSALNESARFEVLHSLAAEQVRLAEIDAFPKITPRLVYQHTNDGGDFFGAGVSFPLPFWRQNQPQAVLAAAEVRVAEVNRGFAKQEGLVQQICNTKSAAVNRQEQAAIFRDKVIPAFKNALISQEKLYLSGKGNVLQVWQTMRAFNEVQLEALQLWLQAATTRAELVILIGEEV